MLIGEKLSEVLADKGRSIVAVYHEGLHGYSRLHLGRNICKHKLESLGGDVLGHSVRGHDAAIYRAGIDGATVGGEAVREAGK